MSSISRLAFGLVATLGLAAGTAAQAQQPLDLAQVQANGFGLFSPVQHRTFMSSGGFSVVGEQPDPNGDGSAVIFQHTSGVPIVLKYRQCGAPGCLFMEMIAPISSEVLPEPFAIDAINGFNRASPVTLLTSEANGGIAIRFKMPAAKDCRDDCQQSLISPFVRTTFGIYERMQSERNNRTVSYSPDASGDVAEIYAAAMQASEQLGAAYEIALTGDVAEAHASFGSTDVDVGEGAVVDAFFLVARDMEGLGATFEMNSGK